MSVLAILSAASKLEVAAKNAQLVNQALEAERQELIKVLADLKAVVSGERKKMHVLEERVYDNDVELKRLQATLVDLQQQEDHRAGARRGRPEETPASRRATATLRNLQGLLVRLEAAVEQSASNPDAVTP
jgi:hypothetical protein